MISVLLTILKIIGIVLLCILGLLLLVLFTVLLVPIRYQASASFMEKIFQGEASVTWLLHALRVRAGYHPDSGPYFWVRVLGFKLMDSRKKKASKKTDRDTNEKKEAEQNVNPEEEPGTDPVPKISPEVLDSLPEGTPGTEENTSKNAHKKNTKEKIVKGAIKKKESKEQKRARKEEKKKRKEAEKARKAEEKARKKVEKAQKAEEKARKKAESKQKREAMKEKAEEILDMLQNKENQKSLRMVKTQIGKLLCHILPKDLRLNGRIGLSDPAATGQLLGIIYAFYPLYGDQIQVVGEFEDEVIEVQVFLKGRIRIGSLIIIAARVIIDKNVRRMIKTVGGKKHVGE